MRHMLLALVLAAAATTAHANIWQDAIDSTSEDAAQRARYEAKLREGDVAVLQANLHSVSPTEKKRQVHRAIQSYREAAAAQPRDAEPYFRIANVLHSFYLDSCFNYPSVNITQSPFRDCSDPSKTDVAIAKQTIEAWNAAEARAPLDPRFSADGGSSILFERALLHTKLATIDGFNAAAKDYLAYLDRSDGRGEGMENAWGNLAETYMMLSRLDESIDAYREALRVGSSVSTRYGYAVALDRGDRPAMARDVILAQGRSSLEYFKQQIEDYSTFFVPVGEKFYYFALAEEAFGNLEAAIRHWRTYISSGAHPQFQPRAKQHLNALLAKRRTRPTPPRDPFWDLK